MSADFWSPLRATTPARIGLGRAGNGVPTAELLDFGAAHAAARDAIHLPLDTTTLLADLATLGLGQPVAITSAAADRGEYLRRPDLGRTPGTDLAGALAGIAPTDIAVVVADGLSAEGAARHAVPVLGALADLLPGRLGTPVVATQARVALGDHVGESLGAQMVLVLIGERPGLSSSDSLGAYLTWAPHPGVMDSARNCLSNIRPPDGLDYDTAARTIASLFARAHELGATGVALKADSHDEIAN